MAYGALERGRGFFGRRGRKGYAKDAKKRKENNNKSTNEFINLL
jgi:hypothetical protein